MTKLTDAELRALVLLCLHELGHKGCSADPAVTAALAKLTAERQRRGAERNVTEQEMREEAIYRVGLLVGRLT